MNHLNINGSVINYFADWYPASKEQPHKNNTGKIGLNGAKSGLITHRKSHNSEPKTNHQVVKWSL